jgi:hypothetical protein
MSNRSRSAGGPPEGGGAAGFVGACEHERTRSKAAEVPGEPAAQWLAELGHDHLWSMLRCGIRVRVLDGRIITWPAT